MESLFEGRVKEWLRRLTSGRLRSIFLGTAVTGLVQSSTAVTVMIVGLVEAGTLALPQAFDLIMGANVGTTVTAWIVAAGQLGESLQIPSFSWLPPLMAISGILYKVFGGEHCDRQAELLTGLGTLFLGLAWMGQISADQGRVIEIMFIMGQNPLFGILAGILITCMIQSSSAGIGILQMLAMQGQVTLGTGIYVILGQNIGTCITTLAAGMGMGKAAKAATWFHLGFNIIGVAAAAPLAVLVFRLWPALAARPVDAIGLALFHTIFNLLSVLVVYPCTNASSTHSY